MSVNDLKMILFEMLNVKHVFGSSFCFKVCLKSCKLVIKHKNSRGNENIMHEII